MLTRYSQTAFNVFEYLFLVSPYPLFQPLQFLYASESYAQPVRFVYLKSYEGEYSPMVFMGGIGRIDGDLFACEHEVQFS